MNKEKALELIEKLDSYARRLDEWDYGLPVYNYESETHIDNMIEIVMKAFEENGDD